MKINIEDVREKRNAPRVRFRESVQFGLRGLESFDGSLGCDISATGLRLVVQKFIPLNTELSLLIQLENDRCVECLAKVVWVQENPFSENYQIGLSFLDEESAVFFHQDVHRFVDASLN